MLIKEYTLSCMGIPSLISIGLSGFTKDVSRSLSWAHLGASKNQGPYYGPQIVKLLQSWCCNGQRRSMN